MTRTSVAAGYIALRCPQHAGPARRTALPDTPSPTPVVSLIDADQDFARLIPAGDLELARRALRLREVRLAPDAPVTCAHADLLGLVLVEGAVWREVRVGQGGAPQLLGPGAIVCEPGASDRAGPGGLGVAITSVRMAVLDRRFLLASTRWPALASELLRRLAEQERDLAIQAAIGQLPRVDERLLALMWQLGHRWGRVGADGVRLPMRLTHATLGRFVGARRPTVSLALAALRERGLIAREADGLWTLLGEPPVLTARDPAPVPELFARR